MAGAGDIGLTAGLYQMIGAAFVCGLMVLAVRRLHQLKELVIEAFGSKVALLLGHPFLQAEMRFDDEFGHGFLCCCYLNCAGHRPLRPQESPSPVAAKAVTGEENYSVFVVGPGGG